MVQETFTSNSWAQSCSSLLIGVSCGWVFCKDYHDALSYARGEEQGGRRWRDEFFDAKSNQSFLSVRNGLSFLGSNRFPNFILLGT
jgi:hypothetical protein